MLCRWIWIFGIGLIVAVFPCFAAAEESWTSHLLAHAAGGAFIGTDERSGDSVIRVGPPGESKPGTRMYMDRNPGPGGDFGDRVFHVVPPPEEKQETEVHFGPLLITPEITWPENNWPGMIKPDPRVPHGRMPKEQRAPGRRE